jgi:hypothetical protein
VKLDKVFENRLLSQVLFKDDPGRLDHLHLSVLLKYRHEMGQSTPKQLHATNSVVLSWWQALYFIINLTLNSAELKYFQRFDRT